MFLLAFYTYGLFDLYLVYSNWFIRLIPLVFNRIDVFIKIIIEIRRLVCCRGIMFEKFVVSIVLAMII